MITRVDTSFFLILTFFGCIEQSAIPHLSHTDKSFEIDSTYFLGYWSGDLRFDGYHLPLGFDVEKNKIYFDNPAQSGDHIAVDSFILNESSLTIHFKQLIFELTSTQRDEVRATMIEGKDKRLFRLHRGKENALPDRPQTPTPTKEYATQEVRIQHEISKEEDKPDTIQLAGTISLPDPDPSAIAILLTGSGPQDRDETIFHHKPFAVIADHLTKAGLGVLRYDDRGTAQSTGSHSFSTSFDFAIDAAAVFNYLKKEYPTTPIGFIGHSEGGMIAQIADSLIHGAAFHIYLAAPGLEIVDLMVTQNSKVLQSVMSPQGLKTYTSGLKPIFQLVADSRDRSEKQAELNEKAKTLYNSLTKEDALNLAPSDMMYAMSVSQIMYLNWYQFFFRYKPEKYLSQITSPILALNGSKDIQVTIENLEAIKRNAYNANVTVIELENTNHLFQQCKICTINEYGMLTQTISNQTLESITSWLEDNEFIIRN